MEINSYAPEIDIHTTQMDSSFGRYWSISCCGEIINTCKEIGSYHKETVLYYTEIGAVSLELEYHIMEMVKIVVSFAFQLARLMNRMMRGRY